MFYILDNEKLNENRMALDIDEGYDLSLFHTGKETLLSENDIPLRFHQRDGKVKKTAEPLSRTNVGLLISKRVRKIFDNAGVSGVNYIPATAVNRDGETVRSADFVVDFTESEDLGLSENDFKSKNKLLFRNCVDKIEPAQSFVSTSQLFSLKYAPEVTLVTDDLADKLREIKGVTLTSIEDLNKHKEVSILNGSVVGMGLVTGAFSIEDFLEL